jgi:hypothetical protein
MKAETTKHLALGVVALGIAFGIGSVWWGRGATRAELEQRIEEKAFQTLSKGSSLHRLTRQDIEVVDVAIDQRRGARKLKTTLRIRRCRFPYPATMDKAPEFEPDGFALIEVLALCEVESVPAFSLASPLRRPYWTCVFVEGSTDKTVLNSEVADRKWREDDGKDANTIFDALVSSTHVTTYSLFSLSVATDLIATRCLRRQGRFDEASRIRPWGLGWGEAVEPPWYERFRRELELIERQSRK